MIAHEIKKCPLFAGIEDHQLESLLICLTASNRTYAKDKYIFRAESKAEYVGIVRSGGVYVIQEDFWGNRVILSHINPGGLFGEAFSCAQTAQLPVSVIAAEKSEILLIDYRKIVTTCSSSCIFHTRLIKNMLRILAEKNIMLTRKMEHLSKRTTREKLLSFLSMQAIHAQQAGHAQQSGHAQLVGREKSNIVEMPFNRQELADYLCVDRSALSRELSSMKKEGLLRYDKNRFELLHNVVNT